MKLYERQGDELQETKCHKEREEEMEGKGKQNGFPLHIHFSFNIPSYKMMIFS